MQKPLQMATQVALCMLWVSCFFSFPKAKAQAADSLLRFTTVLPAANTGMNYQPWLHPSLDSLIASVWNSTNNNWVDVRLPLPGNYKISRIELYDHAGVFNTNPAVLLYQNDAVLTTVGNFTGPGFKSFVQYPLADTPRCNAIVVRKFGNNIPQKVRVYGRWESALQHPYVDTTPAIIRLPNAIKLPIAGRRWYALNYAPNGVGALFNGVTAETINTGYAQFNLRFDCVYPVEQGEQLTISEIRMYDANGIFTSNPSRLYAIRQNNEKVLLATFTGSRFNEWVGPVPDKPSFDGDRFLLPKPIDSIKYLVLDCYKSDLPTELELYGHYTTPAAIAISPGLLSRPPYSFTMGINAFEWDFVNPLVNSRQIDEAKYAGGIKNFRAFRHYLDWKRMEDKPAKYTFNPCHGGGWDLDMTYQRCKTDSIMVLACIKNIPNWMRNTYPEGQRAEDNAPVVFGDSKDSVASYLAYAQMGFQFAARYGRNTGLATSLLKVDTLPRWTADPPNQTRMGLDLIRYIEAGNELDKWWRGAHGYMNPYQLAAMLSAFYDGHKGSLGAGAGVKTADSTMVVVIPGLAFHDASYLRGMLEWCRNNRGYRTNGSVDVCWDIINYHHYSSNEHETTNGMATKGAAPELSDTKAVADSIVLFSKMYLHNMPVWVTELGFDHHPQSSLGAIPIGNKTIAQTAADWLLRSSLVYMQSGVERLFYYDLKDFHSQSEVKFATMGLTDSFIRRRPNLNFVWQTNQLMGNYQYNRRMNVWPLIDEYKNGTDSVYVAWVPKKIGQYASFSLPLPGATSALIWQPTDTGQLMNGRQVTITSGLLSDTASETPVFIKPQYSIGAQARTTKSNSTASQNQLNGGYFSVVAFPNPFSENLYFTIGSNSSGYYQIQLFNIAGQAIAAPTKRYLKNGEKHTIKVKLPPGYKGTILYRCQKDDRVLTGYVVGLK
jgi:hypothetical protein